MLQTAPNLTKYQGGGAEAEMVIKNSLGQVLIMFISYNIKEYSWDSLGFQKCGRYLNNSKCNVTLSGAEQRSTGRKKRSRASFQCWLR